MKRLVWTEPAKADIRRLVGKQPCVSLLRCIASRIPAKATYKALRGREELRLRIGDYRLFFVCPAVDIIEIRRVLHRREAYR